MFIILYRFISQKQIHIVTGQIPILISPMIVFWICINIYRKKWSRYCIDMPHAEDMGCVFCFGSLMYWLLNIFMWEWFKTFWGIKHLLSSYFRVSFGQDFDLTRIYVCFVFVVPFLVTWFSSSRNCQLPASCFPLCDRLNRQKKN
jgi:hypothetical protein